MLGGAGLGAVPAWGGVPRAGGRSAGLRHHCGGCNFNLQRSPLKKQPLKAWAGAMQQTRVLRVGGRARARRQLSPGCPGVPGPCREEGHVCAGESPSTSCRLFSGGAPHCGSGYRGRAVMGSSRDIRDGDIYSNIGLLHPSVPHVPCPPTLKVGRLPPELRKPTKGVSSGYFGGVWEEAGGDAAPCQHLMALLLGQGSMVAASLFLPPCATHLVCPPPSKSSPVPSAWEGHRHCHRMPGASGGSGECPAAGTPWLSGC